MQHIQDNVAGIKLAFSLAAKDHFGNNLEFRVARVSILKVQVSWFVSWPWDVLSELIVHDYVLWTL